MSYLIGVISWQTQNFRLNFYKPLRKEKQNTLGITAHKKV